MVLIQTRRWLQKLVFLEVESCHSDSSRSPGRLPCLSLWSLQQFELLPLSPTFAFCDVPSHRPSLHIETNRIYLLRKIHRERRCMSHIFSQTARMRNSSEAELECILGGLREGREVEGRKLFSDSDPQSLHWLDRIGKEESCALPALMRDLRVSLMILKSWRKTN